MSREGNENMRALNALPCQLLYHEIMLHIFAFLRLVVLYTECISTMGQLQNNLCNNRLTARETSD